MNRAERLPTLINALAAQDLDERFEVIVVDDGSTDDTFATLERLVEHAPFELRPLQLDRNRGPATARNLGWKAARASVVAFTDDDCAPQPRWLRAMLAALADADVVQGRTMPDPTRVARLGPFSHTIHVESETGYYETCNMAYRRSVLEQLGGFDETFRFPYGEDTDLAWRAKEMGARTAFADDAVVIHDVFTPSFRDHLNGIRRREGLVHALSQHPNLRSSLRLGLFFRATHPPALAGAAAALLVAAAPRRRRNWFTAFLAGAWYAYACRWNTYGPPRKVDWLGVVPQRFVADAYEIAVLARASGRHRALLL